jgi:3-hydroxybutyryl-CoA dehydrogenase
VRLHDLKEAVLESAKKSVDFFIPAQCQQAGMADRSGEVLSRISFTASLPEAVAEADLVIEAITESIPAKQEIFAKIEKEVRADTIIGTNSSSIPVSKIETSLKNRRRALNIHFSSPIERLYYVEVMRGSATDDKAVATAVEWIKGIGCLPLVNKKECLGFVFNRVWHAARRDALKAWAEGYADLRDIDRAWMLFTGMPMGPFGIMDYIGLDVVYSVQKMYFDETGDPGMMPPQELQKMVDRGELGMKSGRGFYSWPQPEFLSPDFLGKKR